MGHINFDKGSGKKKRVSGFYLALAICLVAVGGVAVTTFISSMQGIDQETKNSNDISTVTTAPTEPVGHVVTNIPDTRTNPRETSAATFTTASKTADLFMLPLTNEVIRKFSDLKPVFSPTMNDWRVHNGADFKGTLNQSVKALADGTIVSISKDPLWGDVIAIDHGYGIKSRYCGVKVASLKENLPVKVGDIIGKLSKIPCESNDDPHLHLEIMVNDEYVNPIEAIGREVNFLSPQTTNSATTTK
ncbi:MAG TPA: hypothetical protein DEB10_04770 [Ruminococcaceae bacterium]|nr:hypothetical protein [Oscillospiraceae bacterium]